MLHTETFFRFGLWGSTGVGYLRPNESSQWRSPDLHLPNGFNFFCYWSLSMSYFSWNFSIAKFSLNALKLNRRFIHMLVVFGRGIIMHRISGEILNSICGFSISHFMNLQNGWTLSLSFMERFGVWVYGEMVDVSTMRSS